MTTDRHPDTGRFTTPRMATAWPGMSFTGAMPVVTQLHLSTTEPAGSWFRAPGVASLEVRDFRAAPFAPAPMPGQPAPGTASIQAGERR